MVSVRENILGNNSIEVVGLRKACNILLAPKGHKDIVAFGTSELNYVRGRVNTVRAPPNSGKLVELRSVVACNLEDTGLAWLQ